jgi:hypothetical protein
MIDMVAFVILIAVITTAFVVIALLLDGDD